MKKITVSLVAALFLLAFIPTQVKAAPEKSPVSIVSTAPVESVEAKVLLNRLEEIREMTKSKLSSSDKKQLRQEVRLIKQNLKALSGGVYLSVGAIIIIILLLLLLV